MNSNPQTTKFTSLQIKTAQQAIKEADKFLEEGALGKRPFLSTRWKKVNTMLLGGLWHGASINFVFWGIFHGAILVIHRIFSRSEMNKRIVLEFHSAHLFVSWVITQWLVFMAWLIFRVEEKTALIRSLKSYLAMDSSFDIEEALGAMPERATYVFVLLIIFIILHIFSSINEGSTKYHIAKLSSVKWGLLMGTFTSAILFMRPEEVVQFIYFRF